MRRLRWELGQMAELWSMAERFLALVVVCSAFASSAMSERWVSDGYRLVSIQDLADGSGILAFLAPINASSTYGDDISSLVVSARLESEARIHVRITDANNTRWEIPQSLIPRPSFDDPSSPSVSTKGALGFSYTAEPFGFAITRLSTAEVLFNSTPTSNDFDGPNSFGPLVFKDQYLEISTSLPHNSALYGLGESTRPAGLRLAAGELFTLWSSDIGEFNVNIDLYGSFPYYLDVREGGNTHGVLLLNSNGMDVFYEGSFLTFKPIGGILDFYFFAGPTPAAVLSQYTEIVGRPAAMPYWSLGLHQCRWGYKNVKELQEVVAKYTEANIPLEAIWSDIDYMDHYKDFTLDPVNYPQEELAAFLEQLHSGDRYYIQIIDPGIATDENYGTFTRGIEHDIFLKELDGSRFLAQVWPGPVYFPDFLHPRIQDYWTSEIERFHKVAAFDGLWIDMNEDSNFCTGVACSIGTIPSDKSFESLITCFLNCSASSNTKWENPPYSIHNANGPEPLNHKTIGVAVAHAGGELEYDTHNLYGFSEAIVTNRALVSLFGKRPFLLSRSTFPGAGAYTAHWTGDNAATWDELAYSIVGVLNSGLFGIPMIGADICGFSGITTEELCSRWIEVGAFYPFARNHGDIQSNRHELYVWDSVAEISRSVLGMRYRLLPYLYTLVYEAHTSGAPMARPLFYEFPSDSNTWDVDFQFLLGKAFLVSPVLTEGATSVDAYFPTGTWYNLFDHTQVISETGRGSIRTLQAPLGTINVHVAGGSIVVMQDEALTTAQARSTNFTLLVAFSGSFPAQNSRASGELFLDDGERLEMQLDDGSSTLVTFHAIASETGGSVESTPTFGDFALKHVRSCVHEIILLGLPNPLPPSASALTLNDRSAPDSVTITSTAPSVVHISNLHLPLDQKFSVAWHLTTVSSVVTTFSRLSDE